MSTFQLAVLIGAASGLGVALLIYALRPAVPDLTDALSRLDGQPESGSPATPSSAPDLRQRARSWAASTVVRIPGVRAPIRELQLIDMSIEAYAARKLTYAALGALYPAVIILLLSAGDVALPFTIPVAVGIGLAVAGFFVPDVTVRRQAAGARREFRRALTSYFDLVALERSAARGATESLTRPAELAEGWAFRRIRSALQEAELAQLQPWDALSDLAEEVGVPELADLASIGRLAGESGASVKETYLSNAKKLRVALAADEETAANEASERMTIPVTLLCLVFLMLILYPAATRLLLTP